MKITIVCGFFFPMPPEEGGATEKMWWRLAQIYAQRGHSVTLISRKWKDWPHEENINGIRLIRIRGANHRSKLWKNLCLDALWGMRVLFALPVSDILITNTITLPIFAPYLRPSAGRLVINLNRYPKGQLRYYRRAVRIQVPTLEISTAARSQASGLACRVKLIPNPIDCAQFITTQKSLHLNQSLPLKIGFFGRIHPEKGIHTLVRAARTLASKSTDSSAPLPPWQLILRGPTDIPRGGGGEEYIRRLHSLAPELWRTDKIMLEAPTFNARELAEAYAKLDIFCYPSEAAKGETQGISIFEAMATGLSVVTSNLSVFKDYLSPEVDSLNFPMGDSIKLAETLERLLRSPELRHQLGIAARKAALKIDDAQIATKHLVDYATLLSEHADR